ncbi:MAG: ribose-5-phosphate isomerase A [Candidatus Westeberhardia cardiocondylae]|nr:ribose-5-phosphate isomerase A [Candidatus Westeberhardia cardiocondylae]
MILKQEKLKKMVAWSALQYIRSNSIIGVGTGSTVSYFIDALSSVKYKILGAVSSSRISSIQLRKVGIPIYNLDCVYDNIDVYIDSADEIDGLMQMIKGGGGALTKEKIIASAARKFICIVDIDKVVNVLGKFPLPIEIIPMACSVVSKKLTFLGGLPEYRKNVVTDNGNIILDVYNLDFSHAISLENVLNNIPGVVTVGLFAMRTADIMLIGSNAGVETRIL